MKYTGSFKIWEKSGVLLFLELVLVEKCEVETMQICNTWLMHGWVHHPMDGVDIQVEERRHRWNCFLLILVIHKA